MRSSYKIFFASLLGAAVAFGGTCAVQAQEDEFMLEEITVTAEKKAENVQDTAMSVSAITGSDIKDKSITDLQSALQRLAGVNILGIPGGGQVFIRGVGSTLDSNLGDPSVSVAIDDIYVGRTEAALSSMYDVERVEVLRGPQGTMYGRNAAGGQINLISKDPTDDFEASANLTLGNYSLMNAGAVVNVPLSENWAGRVALNTESREGYISDGSDSADKVAGRLKVSYKPSERLSILFTTEQTNDKSSAANTVPAEGSAGNLPIMGPVGDWAWTVPDADNDGVGDDVLDADGEEGSNGIPDIVDLGWETIGDAWSQDEYHLAPVMDNTFQFYQVKLNYDMDWASLYVQPAVNINKRTLWSELLFGISQGSDLTEQSYEETQYSADVRLQSPADSNIDWIVGAYWLDSENKDANSTVETDVLELSAEDWTEEDGGAWATAQYRRPSEVYAFYGQSTVPVSDWFRITGGLRYTVDNRQMAYRFANVDVLEGDDYYSEDLPVGDYGLVYDSGVVEYSKDFDNVTYKGGLEFDLNDESMLYLSVTTGYKAGGLNLQSAPYITEYDPEELVSYTIGSKNRFLDNHLQLNAEAYYYDYDGYQVQAYVQVLDALTGEYVNQQMTLNADTGYNMGLEIEVDYLLTMNDKMDVTCAYMDAEYGSVVLPASPFYEYEFDLDGRKMANTPEYSGTIGYEHYWTTEDGGSLTGRIESKISDGYWATHEQYMTYGYQSSYHMTNLYLTYAFPSQKYSTGLWIKNLENEDVTVRAMPGYRRSIMAPRTYGVNFSAKF